MLMCQVREGEVEQLGLLYQRHRAPLLNYFVRLTGGLQLSEDLVHEVFLRILKYRHTFRPENRFPSWMYQIARNALYESWHKRKHLVPLETDELELESELICPGPGPDLSLDQKQESARLNRALAELPVESREVLVLSRFQDLKYEEIAGILECGVGAVKMRVHRALKELRDRFLMLEQKK